MFGRLLAPSLIISLVGAASSQAAAADVSQRFLVTVGSAGYGHVCITDTGKARGLFRLNGKASSFASAIENGRFSVSAQAGGGKRFECEFALSTELATASSTLGDEAVAVSAQAFLEGPSSFGVGQLPVSVSVRSAAGKNIFEGMLTPAGKFLGASSTRVALSAKCDKKTGIVSGRFGASPLIGIVTSDLLTARCDNGTRISIRATGAPTVPRGSVNQWARSNPQDAAAFITGNTGSGGTNRPSNELLGFPPTIQGGNVSNSTVSSGSNGGGNLSGGTLRIGAESAEPELFDLAVTGYSSASPSLVLGPRVIPNPPTGIALLAPVALDISVPPRPVLDTNFIPTTWGTASTTVGTSGIYSSGNLTKSGSSILGGSYSGATTVGMNVSGATLSLNSAGLTGRTLLPGISAQIRIASSVTINPSTISNASVPPKNITIAAGLLGYTDALGTFFTRPIGGSAEAGWVLLKEGDTAGFAGRNSVIHYEQ